MTLKIKCYWFKANGTYYTTGEGELEEAAWQYFFTAPKPKADKLSAFHIALLKAGGGRLPGLNGIGTDLALTLICEQRFPHHFPAGNFDQ